MTAKRKSKDVVNKSRTIVRRALVSFICVLMIGILGLGIRVFASARTSQITFVTAFVISVVILGVYLVRRRSLQERPVSSLLHEPPVRTRSHFPRVSMEVRRCGANFETARSPAGCLTRRSSTATSIRQTQASR